MFKARFRSVQRGSSIVQFKDVYVGLKTVAILELRWHLYSGLSEHQNKVNFHNFDVFVLWNIVKSHALKKIDL